jgi:hypothetical protein
VPGFCRHWHWGKGANRQPRVDHRADFLDRGRSP